MNIESFPILLTLDDGSTAYYIRRGNRIIVSRPNCWPFGISVIKESMVIVNDAFINTLGWSYIVYGWVTEANIKD